uniref:Uncharacterized protein n=1 Tax=Anguilla anguilla TaxID=7936 RepID=A0A0E9T202_ANGAN
MANRAHAVILLANSIVKNKHRALHQNVCCHSHSVL